MSKVGYLKTLETISFPEKPLEKSFDEKRTLFSNAAIYN
jgi:hypothetical protein